MMADRIEYSWQKFTTLSPEEYSIRLETRRLELLDSLDASVQGNYEQYLINEWLCLTQERDRIFREIHLKSIKRDLNQSILLAYEALKKCLRLSFTLQHSELPDDLRTSMLGCVRKIGRYVNEKQIEPVQIVLHENNFTDDVDVFVPEDISEIKKDFPSADYSFTEKVNEWKMSPDECDTTTVPTETQSNATYESCFDSILISSVNRQRLGVATRCSFITSGPVAPIEFNTKYVDQIKEIMNTSFD